MKNINKSFALLCMGFAAVACVEENFEDNTPKYDTTPGNEIVFSATAGIENGMPEPETKTVYGDQKTDDNGKKWIEINWDGNKDMIQIVSPEAAGPEVGHYRVGSNTPPAGNFSPTHQSASVTKLGDAALQWSESDEYTFYGVYPSFAYDTDTKHGATASLTKEGLFSGSMPIDQNCTLEGDETKGWVAKPDMRYAFMTALDTLNRTDAKSVINLEFKSMVTALQFDIMPGEINYNDPVTNRTVSEMEVISVSLLSSKVDPEQTGKSISGSFNYNIPSGEYSPTQGTRMVSLHFDDKSVKLSSLSEKSLNVTFFILPENFDSTDKLQLQIIFKLGATQVSRIATINTSNQERPIAGGKKYIFNNVQLPPLKTNVVSSSWWDTLDPDTILPQISIPVAANVFANPSYLQSIDASQTQQTLSIDQLWAMGVRGFEIQCSSCTETNNSPTVAEAKSLGNEGIVAAGTQLSKTFGSAFNDLARLLMTSKDANGVPTECLFVICTYSAYQDGYNPYVFVSNLFNYLEAYCAAGGNEYGITTNNFEQINEATTVGDLRGKIAIIIRPGDDERWLYETSEYNNQTGSRYTPRTDPFIQLGNFYDSEKGLTGSIPSALTSDWWKRVMLIADWGAESYDVWDRRYGSNYARQAVFNEKLPSGRGEEKSYFEDYLWAATLENATLGSTSYNSSSSDRNFPTSSIPTSSGFNYEHKMSNSSKAFVQEWMRVIPDGGIGPIAVLKDYDDLFFWQGNYRTIWAKWPGSYTEKTLAIENLFEQAVATRGNAFSDLYINVLSGYYADWDVSHVGLVPQKSSFSTSNGSVAPSNPGKGGNFSGLAKDLNKYTYSLLSAPVGSGTNRLTEVGPWGLVMMDHINLVEDDGFTSADLVELIMMNNFKFDMTTTTPSGGGNGNTGGGENTGGGDNTEGGEEEGGTSSSAWVDDYDSVYLDGENAISFE